jgi:hypothetical protein
MKHYGKGGKVHDDAKADKAGMEAVASKKVKEHEARMHKGAKGYANGGVVARAKAKSHGSC